MDRPERRGFSAPPSARPRLLDMEPGEMRELGYRVIDALVHRWVALPDLPAWRGASRAEMEALLRESAPKAGRPARDVVERALKDVLDRAGRVDHPRFFAFVPSAPTWPSLLAAFLAEGFNTFQGTWLESAGPSQVELVVLDWFREWLALPEGAGGLFTSGGSAANLCALVAAREAHGNPARPVVYLSDQGHSSLERAARIAGVRREHVRRLPGDERFRMDAEALEVAIREDRERGLHPVCACASAGATNTGIVDPLRAIADVCRRSGVWYHVDAAYGGFAILTDRGRETLEGIGCADSVTLDPHKWLFQPYETGCLMVRDPGDLERAFRVLPEYLQDTEMGLDHVNFGDRGLQLTRSFRALKVWMSVQTFGLGAFRAAVDSALDLAEAAERYIERSRHLEGMSPASLGIVCYRFRPESIDLAEDRLEALNAQIQQRLVDDGYAMVSSTRLAGRYSLRLCILNHRTTRHDVESTLARVERLGLEVGRT